MKMVASKRYSIEGLIGVAPGIAGSPAAAVAPVTLIRALPGRPATSAIVSEAGPSVPVAACPRHTVSSLARHREQLRRGVPR
jgi:hypothetical protein